jgi:hypothetical protein
MKITKKPGEFWPLSDKLHVDHYAIPLPSFREALAAPAARKVAAATVDIIFEPTII